MFRLYCSISSVFCAQNFGSFINVTKACEYMLRNATSSPSGLKQIYLLNCNWLAVTMFHFLTTHVTKN